MERILVVDHDAQTRAAIASVLVTAGYVVHEAWEGPGALAAAEQQCIDLVVLDFMLAGSSGIEVCKSLRRSGAAPDMPILFISAASGSATHQAALDAGADDFLTKPIHRAELLLRIRSLLLLRRTRRELAHSNDLLTAQRDALLRAQSQKEELMEIIVHDLKNPLAAITSNASFMTTAREMNDDVRECAAAIERASDNMLRMVHNLLDVSRAEDASLSLQMEQVDIAALVATTSGLMARRAQDRRVTLQTEVDSADLHVRGDVDLLRRLVENLLDNSIRYTPAGGRVCVGAREIDGQLALWVSDGGPGVPEEQRGRIFEKYAQLDRNVDRAQQRFGRGLGLTFVKLVAEAHGGRIWVEDAAPRGACFQLRIPRTRPSLTS